MFQFASSILLIAAVAAGNGSGPQVVVHPLAGTEVKGPLVSLDSTTATVQAGDRPQAFALRDLRAIVFTSPAKPAPSPEGIRVRLLDGSLIIAAQYTATQGEATVKLDGRSLTIPTRSIRSVRFRPPSDKLESQWKENTKGPFAGDVVVVRRESSLDQLEGILHEVSPDIVQFEFDNETIPVKRTKLEGIVYLHPKGPPRDDAVCSLIERDGSRWQVKTIQLAGNKLQIATAAGVAVDVPLTRVARLDFAPSNVVYLSDMEPESVQWTPFVSSTAAGNRLSEIYRPRRDRSFDGDGLWIGPPNNVKRYSKGLSVHSRTLLTYRLAGDFRKFAAEAGIDSRLQGKGNVELVIEGDGNELFRKPIAGNDPPVAIDLDVAGVQRLTILVDFGQSADIADHLNLCEARLIK